MTNPITESTTTDLQWITSLEQCFQLIASNTETRRRFRAAWSTDSFYESFHSLRPHLESLGWKMPGLYWDETGLGAKVAQYDGWLHFIGDTLAWRKPSLAPLVSALMPVAKEWIESLTDEERESLKEFWEEGEEDCCREVGADLGQALKDHADPKVRLAAGTKAAREECLRLLTLGLMGTPPATRGFGKTSKN